MRRLAATINTELPRLSAAASGLSDLFGRSFRVPAAAVAVAAGPSVAAHGYSSLSLSSIESVALPSSSPDPPAHLALSEWSSTPAASAAQPTVCSSGVPPLGLHRGPPLSVRLQTAAVASRLAGAESAGPLLPGTPWTVAGALAPAPGQARLLVATSAPFNVVHANQAAAEMLDLPVGEVEGDAPGLALLMGPGSDPTTFERLFRAVAGKTRAVGESVMYGAFRKPQYLSAQVSPLVARDGSHSHALLVLRCVLSDEVGLCDDTACFA